MAKLDKSEKSEMASQIAQLEELMKERTSEGETLSGEISYLRGREKDLSEMKDEQTKKIATLAEALIKSQKAQADVKEGELGSNSIRI